MNALDLVLLLPVIAAGVLTATVTTVACSRQWGSREKERQIIRAYARDPDRVEKWLAEGAIAWLENDLAEAEAARYRKRIAPFALSGPAIAAVLVALSGTLILWLSAGSL